MPVIIWFFFCIVVSHRFVAGILVAWFILIDLWFPVVLQPSHWTARASASPTSSAWWPSAASAGEGAATPATCTQKYIYSFIFYDQPPTSYEVTYVGVSTFDLDPKSGSDKSDLEGRKSRRLMMMTSPQWGVCTRMCSCVKSLTCTVVLSGCCGWKKHLTSELKIKMMMIKLW